MPAFAGLTVVLVLLAVPASVRASTVSAPELAVPGWAKVASLGVPLADGPSWMRGTTECTNSLRAALSTSDTTGLRADLDCTAALGASAPAVQIVRARALTRLGDVAGGQAMADRLAFDHGDRIPQLLVLRAALPADAGDTASAIKAVRAVQSDPRVVNSYPTTLFARTVLIALGGTS